MQSLANQTALITGSAKRLGRAIALELAASGANIVAHFNSSRDASQDLVNTLKADGVQAWAVQGDLSDPTGCDDLFARVLDTAGPVDILVNNASIFPSDTLADVSEESLATNLRVNAFSPFFLSRRFASQERKGNIVNLLDTRILDYDAEHVSYHLSKRMLYTLTRLTAVEFAPDVRVNAVAPGLVLPPAGKDEAYLENLARTNPLNRHGDAEDIAAAVAFLAKSDFVTGQVVYVDGGRHLRAGLYE